MHKLSWRRRNVAAHPKESTVKGNEGHRAVFAPPDEDRAADYAVTTERNPNRLQSGARAVTACKSRNDRYRCKRCAIRGTQQCNRLQDVGRAGNAMTRTIEATCCADHAAWRDLALSCMGIGAAVVGPLLRLALEP
ncbi:hypothetical protein [Xanthomonas sp. Leaf148]|uniref:hypothetical protein n=1 Tax=Xanthomonas sp. Leaf148 TaxID=1736275 RepID=UPI001F355521|nr:hypothetical protein [Xanthomonas sp. Leaf148]